VGKNVKKKLIKRDVRNEDRPEFRAKKPATGPQDRIQLSVHSGKLHKDPRERKGAVDAWGVGKGGCIQEALQVWVADPTQEYVSLGGARKRQDKHNDPKCRTLRRQAPQKWVLCNQRGGPADLKKSHKKELFQWRKPLRKAWGGTRGDHKKKKSKAIPPPQKTFQHNARNGKHGKTRLRKKNQPPVITKKRTTPKKTR